MRYCARCLQPDTRPNTVFDGNGICPACNYVRSLEDVDWVERFEQLTELLAARPKRKKQGFDCLVGVSGGKDSTRQALWVRERLGLRPLLMCLSYPPQQVSQNGVANISNLINQGFDVVVSSPAPETWRRLIRESFFRFTNWARSSELALFASVPQTAIRYGIPMILWGENPALQVGDLKTSGSTGWDGNNLRYSNTLSSGHQWMLDLGYEPNEVIPYIYPEHAEFNAANIQIIFLGWYLRNWSLFDNAGFSCGYGLSLRADLPADTGDLSGTSNLDEDWHLMNQMIKYYKFGFGKVTEIVSEEIRFGRLTRERAIELVEQYDGACAPRYVDSFCEYIDIPVSRFWGHVRGAVNQTLFSIDSSGVIQRRFQVGMGL